MRVIELDLDKGVETIKVERSILFIKWVTCYQRRNNVIMRYNPKTGQNYFLSFTESIDIRVLFNYHFGKD